MFEVRIIFLFESLFNCSLLLSWTRIIRYARKSDRVASLKGDPIRVALEKRFESGFGNILIDGNRCFFYTISSIDFPQSLGYKWYYFEDYISISRSIIILLVAFLMVY